MSKHKPSKKVEVEKIFSQEKKDKLLLSGIRSHYLQQQAQPPHHQQKMVQARLAHGDD